MTDLDFKLPGNYIANNSKIIARIKKDFKEQKNFHYLFQGMVGCGKTYLAEIIYNCIKHAYEGKHEPKYQKAREIYREYLRRLNSNYSDKNEAIMDSLHCLRGDVVVLDDFGNEKPDTEQSRAFFEDLIIDRYEWTKKGLGKYTIITTNLTAKEISKRYGDRVLDRLYELFTIMKFENRSFRVEKKEIIDDRIKK